MNDRRFALFAYGSLLNLNSFELTLGKKYNGPRPMCTVRGWRRSWDTAMPNEGFYEETPDGPLTPERIMYMNVRGSAEDNVNGVLYFLAEDEVEVFDRREWTYDRILVDWTAPDFEPGAGKAYMYIAKPDWPVIAGRPKAWAAIRKTYLDVIAEGIAGLGESFRAGYERSTDPVPPELILIDKNPSDVYPSSA
jgi:hypothetical protein